LEAFGSMEGNWQGFYEFTFSSLEDMQMVLAVGTWNYLLAFIVFFLGQKILS